MTKILLKKMLATVSAFHEDAGDDEMPLDAPVRGSEAMGSNGDVLEAIASTSRATRSRNRAVRCTPYQRVQALLAQRAPAPASRTRGRPAMKGVARENHIRHVRFFRRTFSSGVTLTHPFIHLTPF